MIEELGSGGCESVGTAPPFRRSRSPVVQWIDFGVLKPLPSDATRSMRYSGESGGIRGIAPLGERGSSWRYSRMRGLARSQGAVTALMWHFCNALGKTLDSVDKNGDHLPIRAVLARMTGTNLSRRTPRRDSRICRKCLKHAT